ncbi:MAG: glycosyltransferase family 39 protein [Bryobacteraceae bacterium]
MPEGFPQPNTDSRRLFWILFITVTIAAVLSCFFDLGRHRLTGWDESAHTEFSREMVETGIWLDTLNEGRVFFDKPPLVTWITAGFFEILGTSEGVARIPSALGGVGTVLAVFLIGARLMSPWTGFLASLFLLTNAVFLQQSRQVSPDGPLSFVVILAIYFWVRYGNTAAGLAGYALCFAAGLMMKHVGAAPPFGAMFLVMLFEAWRQGRPWGVVAAASTGVALALPWHLLMWARHGREFWGPYFVRELFGRIKAPVTGGDHRWYQFFSWLALRYPFSWLTALELPGARFWILAATAAGTVIAYSVPANRIIWYMSPAIPPVAVLAAAAVESDWRRRQGLGTMLVGGLVVAWEMNDRFHEPGVAITAAAVMLAWVAARKWNLARPAAVALLSVVLMHELRIGSRVWSKTPTEADQVADVLMSVRAEENLDGQHWQMTPIVAMEWHPAGYYYARRPVFPRERCRTAAGDLLACISISRPFYLLGRRVDVERIEGWQAKLVKQTGDAFVLRLDNEPSPSAAMRH